MPFFFFILIYLPEDPSIFKIGLSQALTFQPSTQLTLLACSCALWSTVPLARRWLSGDHGYLGTGLVHALPLDVNSSWEGLWDQGIQALVLSAWAGFVELHLWLLSC